MIAKEVAPIDLVQVHRESTEARSGGLHLSTVIKGIMMALDPERFGARSDDDPAQVRALWEVGFAWEELAGDIMARRYFISHPSSRLLFQVEIEKADIFGTPDLMWLDRGAVEKIHEFKGTKISANNPINHPKYRHWHMQTMGYGWMTECNRARFDVLHINGCYEKGLFGAVLPKAYEIEYSAREMRENWKRICNYKRYMEKKGII